MVGHLAIRQLLVQKSYAAANDVALSIGGGW